MEQNNSAIVKANANSNNVYCSIVPKTNEEKVQLFNALESCDVKINDEVGAVIKIKNVYIQEYEKIDTNTGEPRKAHRTILFDEDGKTHVTASNYFYIAIMKIISIWGEPNTWTEPITVKITKKPVKNGMQALSLQIVNE